MWQSKVEPENHFNDVIFIGEGRGRACNLIPILAVMKAESPVYAKNSTSSRVVSRVKA